jgi:hypothetical protein
MTWKLVRFIDRSVYRLFFFKNGLISTQLSVDIINHIGCVKLKKFLKKAMTKLYFGKRYNLKFDCYY